MDASKDIISLASWSIIIFQRYVFYFSSNKTSVIMLYKTLTMSRTVKFYMKDTESSYHLYMKENLRLVCVTMMLIEPKPLL